MLVHACCDSPWTAVALARKYSSVVGVHSKNKCVGLLLARELSLPRPKKLAPRGSVLAGATSV